MNSKSLKFLLSTGFCLFSSLSSQASVDSPLNLDVRYYFQQRLSISGDNKTGNVAIVRLSSKQLLTLLAKQSNVHYPSGAILKVMTDGSVFVTDNDGAVVQDVSQYLELRLDTQPRLFDGKLNRKTLVENSKNYFPIALKIKLPGLTGSVEGIAMEELRTGNRDQDGIQVSSGEITSTINGQGVVNGGKGFFNGKVNLKGREAILK